MTNVVRINLFTGAAIFCASVKCRKKAGRFPHLQLGRLVSEASGTHHVCSRCLWTCVCGRISMTLHWALSKCIVGPSSVGSVACVKKLATSNVESIGSALLAGSDSIGCRLRLQRLVPYMSDTPPLIRRRSHVV